MICSWGQNSSSPSCKSSFMCTEIQMPGVVCQEGVGGGGDPDGDCQIVDAGNPYGESILDNDGGELRDRALHASNGMA